MLFNMVQKEKKVDMKPSLYPKQGELHPKYSSTEVIKRESNAKRSPTF